MNNNVDDPLKPLDDVLLPDIRQENMIDDLSDYHSILSMIELDSAVPVEVRQIFENAKNVSLYSYFVYRFHQIAEMVGYSALEMALKMLCEKYNDVPPMGLGKLLYHAKKKKWIDNDYFEDLQQSTVIGI